jgi:hypothetical protein
VIREQVRFIVEAKIDETPVGLRGGLIEKELPDQRGSFIFQDIDKANDRFTVILLFDELNGNGLAIGDEGLGSFVDKISNDAAFILDGRADEELIIGGIDAGLHELDEKVFTSGSIDGFFVYLGDAETQAESQDAQGGNFEPF